MKSADGQNSAAASEGDLCNSDCWNARSPDVFANDSGQAFFRSGGNEFRIGDQRVGQGGRAFAIVFRWKSFDGFANYALGVFGVLVEGGDDLRTGDRLVAGIPAIIIRDHSDDAVTYLGFTGELRSEEHTSELQSH